MVRLWDSILKNDENLDAEQVVNLVQQSLCAIGSAFQSLNTHCRKRFQGCVPKEFRSLADDQLYKSEATLSPWLFGSNLEERMKSKVDSSTFPRKVISREIPKFRVNPYQNQNGNVPNSRSQRRGKRRPFLPQKQYQRCRQQKRGKPAHTQTHSSKEERWKQACNRHESAKRVHGVHPFQNGRHIPAKICSQTTGQFYDKTLFKGHISNCPSGRKIENLSSLHLEGCTLPIHLPPFWSLFFRQNFRQSNEASDCISLSHGGQIINFSGRHIDHDKLSQA